MDQYGFLETDFQLGVAVVLILTVLEMARRSIGWPLPLVAICALAYGLLGNHIPGEFGHARAPIYSFFGTMIIAEGGIWGSLTGISVSVVAIFVIFGAVLNAGEAGQGFMNVASSGGQIMPPLMGAGAFVMVELTGIPYTQIMVAALPPAILYFFAVWVGINAYAKRYDLPAIPEDQRPLLRTLRITSAFFMVPFSMLLRGMFVAEYTAQYAACLAILAGTLMLFLDANLSVDWKCTLLRLESVINNGAHQVSMIASIILCASLIIGVLSITGLGVKITSLVLSGSGGLLWPSLLLTALACLLLGMEVPTTAAYVICVSIAGPALIQLGLEPLQAHLFVFWFALLSTITLPVCGAVFTAARMVNENWLKVVLTSMALGIGLYIIPLAMIANPGLIQFGSSPLMALSALVKVGLGLGMVSYGVIAPMGWGAGVTSFSWKLVNWPELEAQATALSRASQD